MSVLLLLDPRLGGAAPTLDPTDRWGATTVRAASVMNALVAAESGGQQVIVVAPTETHASLSEEVQAFARIGARAVPPYSLVDTAADLNGPLLIGWLDQPTAPPALWTRLAGALELGITAVTAARIDERAPIARADGGAFGPLHDDAAELDVWSSFVRTESGDAAYVEECLGRTPQVAYTIAARRPDGRPTVIENPPFMADGRPMPTTYWLIDPELNKRIGTIEASGGVDQAEADLGLELLAETHDRYRAYRDSLIAEDYEGYRPSGGVGGTRVGVKCLHTHFAWYLAGGDDPVGDWTQQRLNSSEERS